MLAMLEVSVADRGGTYVACDTDSMMVVSTATGGLVKCPGGDLRHDGDEAVRALSWREVDEIRDKFSTLSPYDASCVDPNDLAKLEAENFDIDDASTRRQLYALGISAKRYALFDITSEGVPRLRKASEHGLGHLLNPIDLTRSETRWIEEAWKQIVHASLERQGVG